MLELYGYEVRSVSFLQLIPFINFKPYEDIEWSVIGAFPLDDFKA